jgi:hypothetical protein
MRATASTGPWTNEGGSGVFSPASPAGYTTSGVTSIVNPTFFTLGYQTSILPISLQSFDAELKNGMVEVKWSTAMEKNNDYFTIERAAEGELQFDSISFTYGAGNSNNLLHYQDIDPNPLPGVSYYRLKQTDFDRKFSYSSVVRIVNNKDFTLSIYPNPAMESLPVYLALEGKKDKNVYITISDVTGRVMYSGAADLSSPINIGELKMQASLSAGVYMVRISGYKFREDRKLIIR